LRRTKILVLDEATSSIDLETDEAVQQILRGSDFKGVTTITVCFRACKRKPVDQAWLCSQIAHRINTIMDSDMVLVMSDGKVAEYDAPEKLLENHSSLFYALVEEAGLGKPAL